ncbi:cob(I)yrinic acid a,c-diamide adenosyltransferase [Clostridium estertheticum]|nr:cob(I)yrinic acid a,c-diamide adenosyltransferase [Clostridium estertheticum]WAG71616.1 cob(I)yrinic acid a,c-diamide adenosyltransferase [Clostridium sp. CF011]
MKQNNEYDVVVLDELTIELYFKFMDIECILELIKNKPEV